MGTELKMVCTHGRGYFRGKSGYREVLLRMVAISAFRFNGSPHPLFFIYLFINFFLWKKSVLDIESLFLLVLSLRIR